jgi:hypothetical protein
MHAMKQFKECWHHKLFTEPLSYWDTEYLCLVWTRTLFDKDHLIYALYLHHSSRHCCCGNHLIDYTVPLHTMDVCMYHYSTHLLKSHSYSPFDWYIANRWYCGTIKFPTWRTVVTTEPWEQRKSTCYLIKTTALAVWQLFGIITAKKQYLIAYCTLKARFQIYASPFSATFVISGLEGRSFTNGKTQPGNINVFPLSFFKEMHVQKQVWDL